MLKVCLAAFIVNFALWERTLVKGNTVTSAIQFTTSSSQSVEILTSIAPTKTTRNNSTLQTNLPYLECPDSVPCSHLGGSCIQCDFNYSCIYGEEVKAECKPISSTIKCTGPQIFNKTFNCRYCYQSHPKNYNCQKQSGCQVVSSPRERYQTNCTVKDDIICLGNRTFPKLLLCNWTSGYRWSTSVLLSLTLGGFGVDRFYLGHWREGLGKLFSFGGLGVWTLVDLILIIIGYVGPADGSLYIF